MGYTTDFDGEFELDKPLTPTLKTFLDNLNDTRRMARSVEGYGIQGEFFTGSDKSTVLDNNRQSTSQPGLWCQWIPNHDGTSIEWDEGEKFYNYAEWLVYLIDRVLRPNGYVLNGTVRWRGEDFSDSGELIVEDNVLTEKPLTGEVFKYAPDLTPSAVWVDKNSEEVFLTKEQVEVSKELKFLEGVKEMLDTEQNQSALQLIEEKLARLK